MTRDDKRPRQPRLTDGEREKARRAILIEAGLRDPLAVKTIDGITPIENLFKTVRI